MMEQNILIPGLGVHHFLHLSGNEKNEKLIGLLSKLKYEKAIVFVKSASSCVALCKLLNEHHFTAPGIHRQMKEDDRFVYL
jgi:superfamily II DNA/RNA helicase